MVANVLINRYCTINSVDQADGTMDEVVYQLRCSELYGFHYRQSRADTSYDVKPITVFTEIPADDIVIKENMRLVFNGVDYRIHSLDKWPMGCPKYIEISLQSDGNG
jgi:hypothetical protein